MPSGAYFASVTVASASAREPTRGAWMPSAPESSAWRMGARSIAGTRTTAAAPTDLGGAHDVLAGKPVDRSVLRVDHDEVPAEQAITSTMPGLGCFTKQPIKVRPSRSFALRPVMAGPIAERVDAGGSAAMPCGGGHVDRAYAMLPGPVNIVGSFVDKDSLRAASHGRVSIGPTGSARSAPRNRRPRARPRSAAGDSTSQCARSAVSSRP